MYSIKDLVVDEHIKNIFKFVSKSKKLGVFLVLMGVYSLYINSLWYYAHDEKMFLVYSGISILIMIIAVLDMYKPHVVSFLWSAIVLSMSILLNIGYTIISGNLFMPFVSIFSLVAVALSWLSYLWIKKAGINSKDLDKYHFILQSCNNLKNKNNSMKIKVSNNFSSSIELIIIENIVLVIGRFKINYYIINKQDLEIYDICENKLPRTSTGKIKIDGRVYRFKMPNKKYQILDALM